MKSSYVDRELGREVVVGAFVVMILLGLGYFTIILSRETWFRKVHAVEVVFTHVMGLRVGDNVLVRGTKVGTVKDIDLIGDRVLVRLSVDRHLHMTTDYVITVMATSVLGGRYVHIDEGTPGLPDVDLSEVLLAQPPQDLVADATALMSRIRRGVTEGGIVENLELFSADLRAMALRLREGRGSIGRLLSEDETLYDDVAATTASLRAITERLSAGEGLAGRLLTEGETIADDLAGALTALRRVSERLERGEGALGKLLSDDTLYEDVRGLIDDTRAAIDDFRETAPITTFTSILFGAL